MNRQSNKQIADTQTNRQKDKQTDRMTDRQMDRQTDRQMDRQTDRDTDRQTDRQTTNHTQRQNQRQTKKRHKHTLIAKQKKPTNKKKTCKQASMLLSIQLNKHVTDPDSRNQAYNTNTSDFIVPSGFALSNSLGMLYNSYELLSAFPVFYIKKTLHQQPTQQRQSHNTNRSQQHGILGWIVRHRSDRRSIRPSVSKIISHEIVNGKCSSLCLPLQLHYSNVSRRSHLVQSQVAILHVVEFVLMDDVRWSLAF